MEPSTGVSPTPDFSPITRFYFHVLSKSQQKSYRLEKEIESQNKSSIRIPLSLSLAISSALNASSAARVSSSGLCFYIYIYLYIYKLDLKAGVAEGGKGLSRGRSSSVGAGREGRNILIEKKSWVEGADLVKGGQVLYYKCHTPGPGFLTWTRGDVALLIRSCTQGLIQIKPAQSR